ncbi:hypothetical protein ABTB66_18110, partial [Acinetobacter baumannii]
EADASARLGGLTLSGSLGFAYGSYTNYPAGPCPLEAQGSATTACNLAGRPLAGLPRWSESLIVDYGRPLAGKVDVVLHADTAWRSGYYG